MAAYDYDLFVIGAGSAGVRAGRMAASYGARVAVAEERKGRMLALARAAEAALGEAADDKLSVLNDIALKSFAAE